MFRAYCFLSTGCACCDSVRLTTETVETQEKADDLLSRLILLPNVTGGDIEQHVPGIGWVLAADAETAVLCHNRQLADLDPNW